MSRIVVKIIVPEVTEFAPELKGVAAANVIQSVAEYGGQIAAALREVPLGAENKPQILDSDHGNELHIGTQRTPKIDAGRRRRIVRAEENVNAVHTQANLVHQGRRENVSLAEGENLAVALSGVPESRNVGALRRLLAKIVLIGVIAMDAIRIADVVADISGTLINVDRSRSRAEESWRRTDHAVGGRNEGEEALRSSAAGSLNLGTLRVRENLVGSAEPLAVTEAFITQEKIGLTAFDRSAEIATKLIALQKRLRIWRAG